MPSEYPPTSVSEPVPILETDASRSLEPQAVTKPATEFVDHGSNSGPVVASLEDIIGQCLHLLQQNPAHLMALVQLGDAYCAVQAFESAALLYKAALDRSPRSPVIAQRLRHALVGRNQRGFPGAEPALAREALFFKGCLDSLTVPSWTSKHEVLTSSSPQSPLWGICGINGWAISNQNIEKVILYLDGQPLQQATYGLSRYDVLQAYPNVPRSSQSGLSARLNTFALVDGPHHLELWAQTHEQQREKIASRQIVVDNSSGCARNMAALVQNFRNQATILDNNPFKLGISLSSKCNLHCIMCRPQDQAGKQHFQTVNMSMEIFEKIKPLIPSATVIIPQGFGEPMMHPHFDEIVAQIRDLNPRAIIIFTTNGTLMRTGRCESLIAAKVSIIEISLDSVHDETYRQIRQGARFSAVVANIEHMIQARKAQGSPCPYLRLKFVVMKQNVDELPDFVRFAARYGIDHIFFNDVEPFYTNADRFMIDHRTHLPTYLEAKALAGELGVFLDGTAISSFEALSGTASTSLDTTFSGTEICPDPYSTMLVETTGDVTVCCFSGGGVLGNVKEQPVEEIWNGPQYVALREGFVTKKYAPECAHCVKRGIIPKLPSELSL